MTLKYEDRNINFKSNYADAIISVRLKRTEVWVFWCLYHMWDVETYKRFEVDCNRFHVVYVLCLTTIRCARKFRNFPLRSGVWLIRLEQELAQMLALYVSVGSSLPTQPVYRVSRFLYGWQERRSASVFICAPSYKEKQKI